MSVVVRAWLYEHDFMSVAQQLFSTKARSEKDVGGERRPEARPEGTSVS